VFIYWFVYFQSTVTYMNFSDGLEHLPLPSYKHKIYIQIYIDMKREREVSTICTFKVRFFWQLWLVGCAGCTVFGCFWQTNLCTNFGQQFFSGPRYLVNPYCLLLDKLRMNIRNLSRVIFSIYLCIVQTFGLTRYYESWIQRKKS